MKSEFWVLPSYCFLRVSEKIYSIILPVSYFQVVIRSTHIFFFESFPRKDVTCCRGFPWSAMQFAIGSNLRHMSDKVSIFNAAHPCFLKCILRYETSSTWLYLSKSVANDVLRKEISFLHQICIMREEFSRFAVFLTHVMFATFCKVDEVQSANLLLLWSFCTGI